MAWVISSLQNYAECPTIQTREVYDLTTKVLYFPVTKLMTNFSNINIVSIQLGLDNVNGVKNTSFFDLFYNTIWVRPVNIDCGLIVEVQYYDLYVWNAYLKESKDITEVLVNNLSGVYLLDNITGTLAPTQEVHTLIKVETIGATTLDGYIEIKTTDKNFQISIIGLRVLLTPIMGYESENLEITYELPVIIATNYNQCEQRRLLLDKSKKTIIGKIFVDDLGTNILMNIFERMGGIVLGIPYPVEELTPVLDNLYGVTNIYVNEDFSDYYEIFKAKYIIVYDKNLKNIGAYEIESLDSSSKLIVLKNAVNSNFYKQYTKIYPMIFCKANRIQPIFLGKNYGEFEVELVEVFTK